MNAREAAHVFVAARICLVLYDVYHVICILTAVARPLVRGWDEIVANHSIVKGRSRRTRTSVLCNAGELSW